MEEQRVRLFVGGLGPSITAADLQRAFGSLGKVSSVELIRDFAYIDFQAASPSALRNVFSTYQGCKWKGGRLRVEKANEDYLTRLKREWETDANTSAKTGLPAAGKVAPDFSALHDLKFFFPRVGKMKTVPANGTGRHKRSFQRWNSKPLALLTLCGCEGQEAEAVDPFNYEHDTYLRLVEKLEDKLSSRTDQAHSKTKASASKNDTRRRQPRDKERVDKPIEITEQKDDKGHVQKPVEAAEEKIDVREPLEDDEDEPSDADGVSVPGLRKRKSKAIKAPTNMWGKIFEAAAGLKDEEDVGDFGFEDDAWESIKPEERKRVKFAEEGKQQERTPSDIKHHAGKRKQECVLNPSNDDAEKSESTEVIKEDEHQTQWAQFASWKSLAGNGGSFSLTGTAATAVRASVAVDYDQNSGKNAMEKS